MAMMKDNISHEEYRSKLANVADLAVSYINTGNGYFRMRDAFNGLAEQCGANKGINDEATIGRRKLLAQSVCIECISRLSSHSCLLPLLLNVKQHLFLSARHNKWKSCVGNVWLTIPNLPNSGIKTARPSQNFYKLWRLWAFPLHKRLETTAL